MRPLRWIVAGWLSVAAAMAAWQVGDKLEIKWGSRWYPGVVLEVDGAKTKIHYDNHSSSWDEWVTDDRLRAPSAVAQATKTPEVKATFAWPDRPEGAEAGLEGAWLRVETYYWGSSLSITNQGWFFTKNGRFSRSPQGGFAFGDFREAAHASKQDGVYWIKGDTLTLQWADGSKPTEYAFARKDDGILLNGITGTAVKGFERGWRLNGKYEGGASVGGGAVASSNTLVFRADGTFGKSEIGTFSVTGDTTVVSGGSQGEAAGTYEFDGYTLTLKLNDGTVKKHTVFAFGDVDAEGRPQYIYRDGTMMRRR